MNSGHKQLNNFKKQKCLKTFYLVNILDNDKKSFKLM